MFCSFSKGITAEQAGKSEPTETKVLLTFEQSIQLPLRESLGCREVPEAGSKPACLPRLSLFAGSPQEPETALNRLKELKNNLANFSHLFSLKMHSIQLERKLESNPTPRICQVVMGKKNMTFLTYKSYERG